MKIGPGQASMSMAINLVIFDCDGVLIDSEMLSCDALIEALAEFDLHVDREFVFSHCIGHSFPEVVERISGLCGYRLSETFTHAYRAALLKSFERNLRPMRGVEAMLAALGLPYCIATSSSTERVERSLLTAGLSGLGVPIFSASMVPRGKPAPDLFLLAASEMGVQPRDCLVIEDSVPGIRAARAAGMTVWRFTGGSHFKLGFGQGDPALADAELANWEEFTALIRRSVPKPTEAL
jgi:HAD superfamily hydrolase (TIGR01509 family)